MKDTFLNKNEQFYELNKFVHKECLEQNFSFSRKKIVKPYRAYSHKWDIYLMSQVETWS